MTIHKKSSAGGSSKNLDKPVAVPDNSSGGYCFYPFCYIRGQLDNLIDY
jgi:hypothetical protein